MLDQEFNRRQVALLRELAEQADPFIKRRLLDLVSRYEKGPIKTRPLPPISINGHDDASSSTPDEGQIAAVAHVLFFSAYDQGEPFLVIAIEAGLLRK